VLLLVHWGPWYWYALSLYLYLFHDQLTFLSWGWRQHVALKHVLKKSIRLHGILSQKIVINIISAMKTSNLKCVKTCVMEQQVMCWVTSQKEMLVHAVHIFLLGS
jgi:hypothetical protein